MKAECIDKGILVYYPTEGTPNNTLLHTVEISNDYVFICSKRALKNKKDLVNALVRNLWKSKKARKKYCL